MSLDEPRSRIESDRKYTKKRNICDWLRENFDSSEVVAYVELFGEKVPVSRDEALMILGCRNV